MATSVNATSVNELIIRLRDEVSANASKTRGSLNSLSNSLKDTGLRSRNISHALQLAASELTNLGPAASLAGNAINAILFASGPAGLALAALAATVGILHMRVSKARENLADLAEKELKAIAKQKDSLKSEQILKGQLRILESLDPELETIRQKYEQLRIAAEKSGGSQETLARIAKAASLEESKVVNTRLNERQKQIDNANEQITALRFQTLALMSVGEQSIRVASAQKLHALSTSELAQAYPALAQGIQAAIERSDAFQRALARVKSGSEGLTEFTKQFGVPIGGASTETGIELAKTFVAGFRALLQQKAPQEDITRAFASFAQQALAAGVPNITGLLGATGLSTKEIGDLLASLRQFTTGIEQITQVTQMPLGFGQWAEEVQTFNREIKGGDLATAIEQSSQLGRTWRDNILDLEKARATAGSIFEDIAQQVQALKNQVIRTLAEIPDVTVKTIEFKTIFTESPARPFSEFLPAMREKFTNLNKLVEELTPEVAFNIPNLASQVQEIAKLSSTIASLQHRRDNPFEGGTLNPQFSRFAARFAGSQIPAFQEQLSIKQFDLASAIFQASQRAAPIVSGGSGGGNTIVIDLRGANISQELLDRQLVPRFESIVRAATGKNIDYRVFN